MKMSWRVGLPLFAILLVAGLFSTGCVTAPVDSTDSHLPNTFGSADAFQTGDKIAVTLTDIPNAPIQSEQTITEDGEITLHLNYRVKAVGKSRKQLQDEIHDYYVPKFYPRCTVTIKAEDRFFYVGGWVKAPNRYIYSGDLTVLKAITAAGGFSDFGKRWEVHVTRLNGKTTKVNCDKALTNSKLDLPIYPGDRIFVPQRTF